MIKSFKHRGLKKFFLTGSKSGIQPDHAKRLQLQLTTLNFAKSILQMNEKGWALHPLHEDLKDHWEVRVNGNWRLTFKFEGEDAEVVDYRDYH